MRNVHLSIAIVVSTISSLAIAQPAGAQAEILFRQARELMAQGKFAEACVAFEGAQKLDPTPGTLLNLAGCREKAGQLASSWSLFLEAERQLRAAQDPRGQQLHDVAKQKAALLETRVSKLEIVVVPEHQIAGLEILRDRDHVDAVMWNRSLPIDGGTYTIVARAPARIEWRTQVTVAGEADKQTVVIPELPPATSAPLPPPPQPAHVTAPHASASTTSTGGRERPPSGSLIAGAGIGTVGLLAGALTFDLLGDAKYASAKATPVGPGQDARYDAANLRRHVAIGLGLAGLVGVGITTYLYVGRARARIHVDVSPSAVSIGGAF